MKKINVAKLHNELLTAGLSIDGIDAEGNISWQSTPTTAQKSQAQRIITAHKPTWYKEERAKEYPTIQDQLDMIYHDQVKGTTTWRDELTRIKTKYPKE